MKRKRKVKKIYGDLIKNELGENVFIIVNFLKEIKRIK